MKTVMKTLALLLGSSALLPSAAMARENDFPTVARVLYVQECMSTRPGSNFEMVNKCSCALDALAAEVSYEDYTTMSTIVKARSIGGERGGTLRDNETLDAPTKRYRDLQTKVMKGCFLTP